MKYETTAPSDDCCSHLNLAHNAAHLQHNTLRRIIAYPHVHVATSVPHSRYTTGNFNDDYFDPLLAVG